MATWATRNLRRVRFPQVMTSCTLQLGKQAEAYATEKNGCAREPSIGSGADGYLGHRQECLCYLKGPRRWRRRRGYPFNRRMRAIANFLAMGLS